MKNTTEWATIGTIVAPFGIRGELKVFPLTDIPNRFTNLEAVYLSPAYARSEIESVRPYKGEMILLKLKGVNDANTAETLRNRALCIPSTELAVLPPDSYYEHDIIGLSVCLLNDKKVGTIADIMHAGPNDVYIIKGAEGQQYLIPAVKEFIKQVDLIRRVMYIEPIAGMLDDDALMDYPSQEKDEEGE